VVKIVFLGIWVILVTASATFGSVFLRGGPEGEADLGEEDLGVEELKTEMTSVPMIRDGEIVGYVIIQLSFQADRSLLEKLKLEPLPYLIDAAFRVVFSSSDMDFRHMRGSDLDRLTERIAEVSNGRMGGKLVRQVLIQQLNYVRKDDIRTNWIGQGAAGE
jgi:hypothetical protein